METPAPLPKICVALSGDAMVSRAAALLPEASFFEFRLDTASDPHEALFEMGALLRQRHGVRAIATCRRCENGGSFQGTAADEIELLRQSIVVGAHIVDLSLETAEEAAINPRALDGLRRGPARLMLSWHDFEKTPPLEPVLARMHRIGADLYKIVPTAKHLRDSLRLLDLLKTHGADGSLVAMSMGFAGVATRVLGPSRGSVFTFASPANGAETAPGQLDVSTLRDLYRVNTIHPGTAVYGVFGKPVTGSRSPLMLNTAFRATSMDAVYLPLETDDPAEAFEAIEQLHLIGASVTMPLKESAMRGLDEIDAVAQELGAVNTLQRTSMGAMRGSNTDVFGIIEPLLQRTSLTGRHALVLGAGGVARAAAFALREQSSQVTITNRTSERAERLAAELGVVSLPANEVAGRHFDLILNATPYGMAGATMEPPVDFSVTSCELFFDLVYHPLQTTLVRAAAAHGIETIRGVEMFIAQGAAQFKLWTDAEPPIDAMRNAVVESLS